MRKSPGALHGDSSLYPPSLVSSMRFHCAPVAGKCPCGYWVVSEVSSDVIDVSNHGALMAITVLGWCLGHREETEA